jgi:phosphohistidine phosphatase SixA
MVRYSQLAMRSCFDVQVICMQKIVLTIAGIFLLSFFGCTNTHSQSSPPARDLPAPIAIPDVSEDVTEAIASTDLSGDLWTQLQQQNTHYFVLMRHALAPGTGDPANFQLEDCSTQRNLSAAGREQAKRTGEAFKQRGIRVDCVLSSQWCRCLETAELLDIAEVEGFPPLNSFFRDRDREPQQTALVREFMRDRGDSRGVTVMVTHFVNVSALSNVNASSGEMVVMRVKEGDRLEVVGQIEGF